MQKTPPQKTIIKKYANRRLYNTETSMYITLEDLCDLVKKGGEFEVVDAKTGEDLTRVVLTQIIFEQESKGSNLLPINFLKQIIRFYDDSLRGMVPHYLESSMEHFIRNQEQMRELAEGAFKVQLEHFPFDMSYYEKVAKQNMELFTETLNLFSAFNPLGGTKKE